MQSESLRHHATDVTTFPLLTFSEQLRMYMGIAMTTSSQACTVPALHWDMGVVLASSTCWRRSSWSSPSDRLRLWRVGLERLSESEWAGGGEGRGDMWVMWLRA